MCYKYKLIVDTRNTLFLSCCYKLSVVWSDSLFHYTCSYLNDVTSSTCTVCEEVTCINMFKRKCHTHSYTYYSGYIVYDAVTCLVGTHAWFQSPIRQLPGISRRQLSNCYTTICAVCDLLYGTIILSLHQYNRPGRSNFCCSGNLSSN